MSDYKNAKVNMSGITDEHIRILLQTMADIGAENIAPNVKVTVSVKRK